LRLGSDKHAELMRQYPNLCLFSNPVADSLDLLAMALEQSGATVKPSYRPVIGCPTRRGIRPPLG